MKVFVAGATGVLGRRLVDRLSDRGHEVVGLTRDDRGDELVRSNGGTPHRGDVLDRRTLDDGIEGSDVVVNGATAIPTKTKPSAEDWSRNDRIRREGTKHLVEAAASANAGRVVQQSVVWVARQPDGSAFDEHSPVNPDRTTQSAVDAERIVFEGVEKHGFDPLVLRGGWFYSADSAQTQVIAENLVTGDMRIIGGGIFGRNDAVLSPIHADDAAAAYVEAIEAGMTGTWHVVDNRPITLATFLRTFAALLGVGEPGRIPGWVARFALGSDTVRFFTNSMPTSNDRFREQVGWEPEYPSCSEGLDAIVETWETEGDPFERPS